MDQLAPLKELKIKIAQNLAVYSLCLVNQAVKCVERMRATHDFGEHAVIRKPPA